MTLIWVVLFIIFFIFVAPLWLLLYYRSKSKLAQGGGLSNEEKAQLDEITQQAERLQQRINVLENILDDKLPNWRAD